MSTSINDIEDAIRAKENALSMLRRNGTCNTCNEYGQYYSDCPWSPDQGHGLPPVMTCNNYRLSYQYEASIRRETEQLKQILEQLSMPSVYADLCKKMSAAKKSDDYQELAKKFRKISSYENSSKKAEECEALAESLIFDKLCKKMSAAKKSSDYKRLAEQFHELTICKKAQPKAAECERLAESLRYDELCRKMNSARTADDYHELEEQFLAFSTYKDAPQKAAECRRLAEPLIYDELCEMMNSASTSDDFRGVAEQFRKITAFKDSVEKAEECERKAMEIEQSEEWKRMGRCYSCGGKLSFFGKICKLCGRKN